MQCLVLIFLVTHTGVCISEESQALVCKYGPKYANLPRVWCKQDSEECCTGFAFGESITALNNGSVEINSTANAFTITVHHLTEGSGMYWCGLMFNDTIIKLAEIYFPEDPPPFNQVWCISRLVLFAILVLSFVSTCVLTHVSEQAKKKVTGDGDEGTRLRDRRGRDGQAGDTTVTEE